MFKKLFLLSILTGLSFFGIAAADYCAAGTLRGTSEGDYIARVVLAGTSGTLDNTTVGSTRTATNYYEYYSGATAPTILSGQQYTITITVGTFANQNAVIAWIDFNGDETFTDPGERLGMATGLTAGQSTGFTFTAPVNTTTGVIRLRVRETFQGASLTDPCAVPFTYGEVEDYDINGHLPFPTALVGGEGRRVIPVDNCPEGDVSPSPYDGLCAGISASNGVPVGATSTGTTTGSVSTTGTSTATGSLGDTSTGNINTGGMLTGNSTTGTITTGDELPPVEEQPIENLDGTCADPEEQSAYEFAHSYKITSKPSCLAARMDGDLLRSDAAKMISKFAINILGKTPDVTKKCVFEDMSNQLDEVQQYAIIACELGLMGLNGDGTVAKNFNPKTALNKVQLVTILSRLLYGNEHNSKDACRYCKHADALKADGVITVTSDLLYPVRRGRAMIMLMRIRKLQ